MRLKPLTTIVLALLFGLTAVAQDVPKADVFLGYSFLRVNSAQQIPSFTANGGVATLGLNFTDHIALEAEFGGYHNGNVNNFQFDTTSFSYLFGPRISYGRSKKVDPYFHALFGVNRASTSISASSLLIPIPAQPIALPDNGRFETSQVNFAMAIGGGLDIKLSRHVTLRPIQVDYYLTRFQTPDFLSPTGTTTNRNQNDFRYAAGVAFSFGGEKPGPPPTVIEPPKMKSCPGGASVPIAEECPKQGIGLGLRADPEAICQGAVSRVSIAGRLPDGAVTQWSVNGEPTGQTLAFEFGSTGRQPGSYRISVKVTAEGYNDALSDTNITVRPYIPPTGTLSASPSEIYVGDNATLNPSFGPAQCGGTRGPVTFSASEGTIHGNQFSSTGVSFDPGASGQQKQVTITAKVSDEKGSASAQATVLVKQRTAITARRLPDIVFPKNSARVNNCGKRVLLEELKSLFESDPTGTVYFVGHISENESASSGLDQKRALNAAAIISAGQGICAHFPAAQIQINAAGSANNTAEFKPYFCEASAGVSERPGQTVAATDDQGKYRRVEVWFVPTGGTPPESAAGSKDAASLGVSSLGCPK